MACYFSYSSLMCFCMFVSCMLGVYAQVVTENVEAARSSEQPLSRTARLNERMKKYLATQTQTPPTVCGPSMNCAIAAYEDGEETIREENILYYCPEGCGEGYSCERNIDDKILKMVIYTCLPSSPPAEATTATSDSSSESVQRRSGPDAHHVHEL